MLENNLFFSLIWGKIDYQNLLLTERVFPSTQNKLTSA